MNKRQIESTRNWLTAGMPVRDNVGSLGDLLYVLTGVYLCDVLDNFSDTKASSRVAKRLVQYLDRSEIDLSGCDPSLLLIALAVLLHYRQSPRALQKFVLEAVDYFATNKLLGSEEQVMLDMLLVASSLSNTPPEPGVLTRRSITADTLDILTSGDETLRNICAQINIASLLGTANILGERDVLTILSTGLLPVAVHRLRLYDLKLAIKALRSLAYLGVQSSAAIEACVTFIESQQRSDGAFGYFSYELMQLRSLSDPRAVREFYLPVTIDCLRCIAEWRVPDFRLIHAPQKEGPS